MAVAGRGCDAVFTGFGVETGEGCGTDSKLSLSDSEDLIVEAAVTFSIGVTARVHAATGVAAASVAFG